MPNIGEAVHLPAVVADGGALALLLIEDPGTGDSRNSSKYSILS